MRIFGIVAIESYKATHIRDQKVEKLIYWCKFWAKEALKINPQDEEAKKYIDFPNNILKK